MGIQGTHKEYYQGNKFGGYQFISLSDIINQFIIGYIGSDKLISKANRTDVQFYAMRALQELSFDTFKSTKAHQIDVPNTLVMPLPHDYINYTKLTWLDSAGIEHPLYPTNRTSNPFQIKQEDDGAYSFPEGLELIVNNDFSTVNANNKPPAPWYRNDTTEYPTGTTIADINVAGADNALTFSHRTRTSHGESNWGHSMAVWQEINVAGQDYVDISATGTAVDMTNGPGILRFGISTNPGDSNSKNLIGTYTPPGTNHEKTIFNLTGAGDTPSYLEWLSTDGTATSKELLNVDVRSYDKVYVLVISYQDFSDTNETLTETNYIDDLSVTNSYASVNLEAKIGNERESSTWNAYKSTTPSENNNDDYEDDTYWPLDGERYGIDPQHAQVNGSFFIDDRLGRIHFSSNISGKTITLKYISDSIGTDEETKVHKFAEEAMYKWIAYAILSTKAGIPEYIVNRFRRDKFAAVRQAKLRLTNIKIEEITQILRGKSKWIKH